MDPSLAPKRPWFQRLWKWCKLHRTRSIAIACASVVVVSGVAAWLYAQSAGTPIIQVTRQMPKPKPVYYAPLTGEVVKNESDLTKPVTAIMIENSPDARPQSGLKDAEIVYEAVAEGGITRFLALYQQKKPQVIGPVRSLRTYYVDWLAQYNGSVAHVGGSYQALQMVRKAPYRDIDQFFNPDAYWRAADRYAPHNVYTSFARIDALNKAKGYKSSKPKTFERSKEDGKPAKQNARTVNLHISGPLYDSVYTYSAKYGVYGRSQAGTPHVDREKGRIGARVVIAIMVDMKKVLEDGYRESIGTKGTGLAYIFQNGGVQKATWRKDTRGSPLMFVKDGKIVPLAPGTTWITAIPKGSGSVTWK
ncbi:MAG TPA: DUF3048 domain-containing protein [Candidatus Saccharibacteria bacterium]|nr:DUF3048 domain-containing protein [Candidatus Saccharibacteria bacterium]